MKTKDQKKKKRRQNVLTIRSAVSLNEEERQQIIDLFVKKTGKSFDKVVSIIDPRIICGVSAKTDAFGFEYSGRKLIETMASEIKIK